MVATASQQWKTESSRLLHTKQEFQAFKEKYSGALPAPIILKTICQEKLQLYSDALDAHDFTTYFKNLSDEKKKLLLCVAGQQEIDSSYITIKLFGIYCTQDLIKKYLSTLGIVTYLQGLVILDNCKHKKFTQTTTNACIFRIFPNFRNSYNCFSVFYTGYHRLPSLLTNEHSRFSGITDPALVELTNENDKCWLIQNCILNQDNDNKIMYYCTPIAPADNNNTHEQMFIKENKKKLWARMCKTNIVLQKIIEHTSAIEQAIFSNDGKYLATSSTEEHGELILSDLVINNNTFIGSDILLTGHTGWIGPVCFNKKSTIVAAESQGCIYVWDVQKRLLLTKLDCPGGMATIMSFNYNDSRLVTIVFDGEANASTITLCDSTDIANIFTIKTMVNNNMFINGITFTPSGDKLIIETKCSAMILNGLSGEVIIKTGIINPECLNNLSCVNAVLMSHLPILATTAYNDNNQCTVALWDINSQERIVVLSENQNNLPGIGVNPSGRFVVSIAGVFSVITTELYNDAVVNCLQWISDKSDIVQRYLLHRLYYAQKNNDTAVLSSDSPEYRILQSLSAAPCGVKEMVEKYLLK
jgi:WD40 repeat protein